MDSRFLWPPFTSEERKWSAVSGGPSELTYLASRPQPIADLGLPILRGRVAKVVTRAATSLVRLDILFESMQPDLREALQTALMFRESAASSAMSGIRSSPDHVAFSRLIGADDPIASNMASLTVAYSAEGTERTIHRALMVDTRPHYAGLWRKHQVWSGGAGSTPQSAIYVPPVHDRVPAAMADLGCFVRDCAGQPVATAAIAYAQFCSISPYADGNGRAGRAFVSNLLARWGITRHIPTPLAVGLLGLPGPQAAALEAFREGDPVKVVELVAQAIVVGVAAINGFLTELQEHLRRSRELLKAHGTRADSAAWPLLSYLLGQPVINAAKAGRAMGFDRVTGHKAVSVLAAANLIAPYGSYPKPVWQAPGVLEIWAGACPERASVVGGGSNEVA